MIPAANATSTCTRKVSAISAMVDSSQYWVQIGDDYMRQGRRNLDGFRMYYDLPETNPTKDHLSDLFDVSEVFDRRRPTPVPKMSE